MIIERTVGTESKSAWAVTQKKKEKKKKKKKRKKRNSQIKIPKPHAHLRIISKFQMNPIKYVEEVKETRFLTYRVLISMANNSVKNP